MKNFFMLDTDICSYIMRESPCGLISVFEAHQGIGDEICISAVTHAEILFGIKLKNSERLNEKYSAFVGLVKIVSWDERSAEEYAAIKIKLNKSGTPIGNMDMMIAASALSIGAFIVTNNKKHFGLVPNLKIADWMR